MQDEEQLLGIIRKGLCKAVNTNEERYDSYREKDNLPPLPDKYVFEILGSEIDPHAIGINHYHIDADMLCQVLLARFDPEEFPSLMDVRLVGVSPTYVKVLVAASGGHFLSLYEPLPMPSVFRWTPFKPQAADARQLSDDEVFLPFEWPKGRKHKEEIAAQTREVSVAELNEVKAFVDSDTGYPGDKRFALLSLRYATNQEDLQKLLWDIGLDKTQHLAVRNMALRLLNISPVVREYTQVVSCFEQLRQDSQYPPLSPGLWNYVRSLSLSIVIKTKDDRIFSVLEEVLESETREDLLVTALRGLRQMNTPESRAKIVDVMENHADATIRRLAKMQHILLTYVPNFDIPPCL